jgi:flagellar assembly protein FliH
MANIINPDEKQNKSIQKFSFAKLDIDTDDIIGYEENPFLPQNHPAEEETGEEKETIPPHSVLDAKERETLLEKIDQLTSDVVRLQMDLEKIEQEHNQELEKAREEAFEEGKKEALETIQSEMHEEIENLKSQYIRSITQLDEKSHIFDQTLQKLEEELLESAFMLAKKVILKEVEKHSAQIAVEIARFLLKNVQESSEVTLKVNPEDFTYISSQFKETLIKIEADEAIQKGGVVLMGGDENIDGTILTRYRQALQFLQKES